MLEFQFVEGDSLYLPLYSLLTLCIVSYYFYAFPSWRNLITSVRAVHLSSLAGGTPATAAAIEAGVEPRVTVVICAYNEGSVVLKTIEHACNLDWPKEKLTVHVCDDSTDKMCIELIEKSVEHWRSQGVKVKRLTRPDRVGYKAGNLRYHFESVEGEYVAYFDADHRPEKDFLRNVLPYFFDENGVEKSEVALVQTPWAYYNTHENILTECGRLSQGPKDIL